MLFSTTGLSILALAASVSAVSGGPRSGKVRESHRDRKRGRLASRSESSSNWCGPVTTSSNITSVEASWTVPTASIPQDGSKGTEYWFYQWVGIDGTGDCPVLLQGGTGQTITNGKVEVYPWYEFWPADPVYPDMKIDAGDDVYVKVDATSDTTGTIYIENYTTKESNTYKVSSDNGSLCYNTAEWIAEDPGDKPAPFPDFTTFKFENCKGSTSDGSEVNLKGSNLRYMEQGGNQMCHAKVNSDSTVTIYDY